MASAFGPAAEPEGYQMDDAKVDAATEAHLKFDSSPTDANRKKLRDAEDALDVNELSAYNVNYGHRRARLNAEANNGEGNGGILHS